MLIELQASCDINTKQFVLDMHSNEINSMLEDDFSYCHQLGVHGYPTLVGNKRGALTQLAHGYEPYANLKLKIEDWIKT